MFRIYVWIDGPDFDADAFQRDAGASLGGTVASRKRMTNGNVEAYAKYWRSGSIEVGKNPEDELQALLVRLKPGLIDLRNSVNARIVAEVVEIFESPETLRGFFCSPPLVALLAEIGAGLDLEIVPRL